MYIYTYKTESDNLKDINYYRLWLTFRTSWVMQ